MSCFKEQLAGYGELTERELDRYLSLDAEVPEELAKAMAYSLQAGGKRLRPALVINACEIMGGTPKDALPYACALEMIHTYSLIHDDLPALDNDNLRRGKPTSHVVFGEAKAILTGDALLSYAFEIMLNAACDSNGIRACRHIARAAGIRGMVGGQWEDVSNEGKAISSHMLRYIHEHKTADMITGGLMAGGAAAGGGSAADSAADERAQSVSGGHAGLCLRGQRAAAGDCRGAGIDFAVQLYGGDFQLHDHPDERAQPDGDCLRDGHSAGTAG